MWDILLVEDNKDIQLVNKKILEKIGIYNVQLAMNLGQAREMIAACPPDIIVLDIMLPDGSGLDFLREMRSGKFATSSGAYAGIPVLLLTARGTPEDVVAGLKSGGDDYLTKPYDYDVLLARIEALLGRAGRLPEAITKGNLTLKIHSDEAFVNGENLLVSQKEFSLLRIFMQNENRVMDAKHLYTLVWGKNMSGNSALRNTVYKLRKKIKNSGFTISYEKGEGYRFERE